MHEEDTIDIVVPDSTIQDDLKFNCKEEDNREPIGEISLSQSTLLVISTADDTFENVSDLTYDKALNSTDELGSSLLRQSSHSSSSDPLNTKDGVLTLTSPEEDVCSEDYRVSSSSVVKQDLTKGSPENDGESVVTVAKEPTADQVIDRKNVHLVAPDNIMASPQSSVNKVAAYVQSLPSPKSNEHLVTEEDLPEDTKDASNDFLDESLTEDDANHSMASSRSKASRQSDLSNLTGRFSNGVGGMFFGSALGTAGTPSGQTVCPFPDDWQFNTIPESIENDEDID